MPSNRTVYATDTLTVWYADIYEIIVWNSREWFFLLHISYTYPLSTYTYLSLSFCPPWSGINLQESQNHAHGKLVCDIRKRLWVNPSKFYWQSVVEMASHRKSFTVNDKLDIIKYAEENPGTSQAAIARKFGIAQPTACSPACERCWDIPRNEATKNTPVNNGPLFLQEAIICVQTQERNILLGIIFDDHHYSRWKMYAIKSFWQRNCSIIADILL